MTKTDPYKILCLQFEEIARLDNQGDSKKSDEVIKNSYYRLQKMHHPDKNTSGVNDLKASMTAALNQAKSQIGTYNNRQNFNNSPEGRDCSRGKTQVRSDSGKHEEGQKSAICKHFSAGRCSFGDTCNHSHGLSTALMSKKPPTKPSKTDSDGANNQLVPTKNKSANVPAQGEAPVAAMVAAILKAIGAVDVSNKVSAMTVAARSPCRHFADNNCKLGDKCPFSHEAAGGASKGTEGRSDDRNKKTPMKGAAGPPCRYFADNNCKLGDKCPYSHEAAGGASKGTEGRSDDRNKKAAMYCRFFADNKCMAAKCPFLHDLSPHRSTGFDSHQLPKDPSRNDHQTSKKITFFDWNDLPKVSHKKIIIIGGTGHGKSTFINSIHNYFEKTTLRTVEVVIPTTHITRTVGAKLHTEAMGSTSDSQTQECTQYIFKDPKNPGQRSITFIDSPGLGDTRGAATDEHNITLVLKAAKEAEASKSLSGIILVMKGTENRSTLNMKAVYTMLKAGMPDAILDNILIVFSYCSFPAECQATKLIPFDTPASNIFHYNNLAFVADLPKIYKESETQEKTRIYLKTVEQSWDLTMGEITEILKVAFAQNFTAISAFENFFNQRMKVF